VKAQCGSFLENIDRKCETCAPERGGTRDEEEITIVID
jgi:hypothetical protein